jgi:hypothetical protein
MNVGGENLYRDRLDAKTLNLVQKQKLAKKAKPFTLKERTMYKVGQDNIMCGCLTTLETQIVLKELHEGVA